MYKQITHQQLKISVSIFYEIYKFTNRNVSLLKALPWTVEAKLVSTHQKIWRKIAFHSETDVFTWMKLFINLKEKNIHLPALQNQHGFRTEEKQNCFLFYGTCF